MNREQVHSRQGAAAPQETNYPSERCWYAVYVRSRHEFRVRELMSRALIENFLPAVERLRRWKDRRKLVTFPLFPGYLFVHVQQRREDLLAVLKTHGVVRFLGKTPGTPEPVPDAQVASLQKIITSGQMIEPYPYLKEGQRVAIKWGPLAGVEGILREKRGQHLLVLSIDILQQGASVKVDAADVEPL
jgi:transcription antitermination factor NusG